PEEQLHTPVLQVVVSVDGLLGVAFVVLEVQLDLQTAQSVDLLNSDLGAVLNGIAVLSSSAGQGAYAADLQDLGTFSSALGSGVASGGSVIGGGAVAAAGNQAENHGQGQHQTKNLFHGKFPSIFIYTRAFRTIPF